MTSPSSADAYHVAGAMLVRAEEPTAAPDTLILHRRVGAERSDRSLLGCRSRAGTASGQFAGQLPEKPSLFDLKQKRRHARRQQIAKIFITRDGQLLARQIDLPFSQRR